MTPQEYEHLVTLARKLTRDLEILVKNSTSEILEYLDLLEEHLVRLLQLLSDTKPN